MRPVAFLLACVCGVSAAWGQTTLRVATFNLGDVRSDELADGATPRLRAAAEILQRLRPNVVLLCEIAYDMPGGPGFKDGEKPGRNAQRFVDLYLAHPQRTGLAPLAVKVFTDQPNRGVPSGLDLDRSGSVVNTLPPVPPRDAAEPTPELTAYAGDCWAWGAFPGQCGMALLIDERLTIDTPNIRTFRKLPWDYMSGGFLPKAADGTPWYDEEKRKSARLSTSGHWDVPVTLPGGGVVHILCSHPVSPMPDGPEMMNRKRHHDEVCFWADYVSDAGWIVDDAGREGGLPRGTDFVLAGTLNADPTRGESFKDPIVTGLGASRKFNLEFVPAAKGVTGPAASDTASGLRLDYVLPAKGLPVSGGGVWRDAPAGAEFPSPHWPVWIDVVIPPREP